MADGRSSTLGGAGGLSTTTACASNALAIAAGDQDDVHWDTLVHLGGLIWPAVLAAGEAVDATAHAVYRFRRPWLRGWHAPSRALGPSARRRWHATPVVGVPAAAVSAASVSGSDESGLREALGHAVSFYRRFRPVRRRTQRDDARSSRLRRHQRPPRRSDGDERPAGDASRAGRRARGCSARMVSRLSTCC